MENKTIKKMAKLFTIGFVFSWLRDNLARVDGGLPSALFLKNRELDKKSAHAGAFCLAYLRWCAIMGNGVRRAVAQKDLL